MKINEVLEVTKRIEGKLEAKERLQKVQATIPPDQVEIRVIRPPKTEVALVVDSAELVKLLDKEIAKQDTTADEAELKAKAK